MTLDILDSKLTSLRAEAERLQHQWNRTISTVQSDTTLSEVGRREKLEQERATARERMKKLREQEDGLVATKKQALEKSLFGMSSTDPNRIIAYRDARDRARQLTREDEARELLTSAKLSGDSSLAQAILAAAIPNNWTAIVREYADSNPTAIQNLNDLKTIAEYERQGTGFAYLIM